MEFKNEIYTISNEKMEELEDVILNGYKCFNIVSNNKYIAEIPLEKDVNLIVYRVHNLENNSIVKWHIQEISVVRINRDNFCKLEELVLQQDQKGDIWHLTRIRSAKDIGYTENGTKCEELNC